MAERHVNFEGLQEPGGFAGSGRPPAQVYELYPRDNREAIAAGIRFLSAKREGPKLTWRSAILTPHCAG